MELSDEGEFRALEQRSAEKLGTTPGNKRRSYLKRKVSKRHYLMADALYENLSASLREFPSLAKRIGVQEQDRTKSGDVQGMISQLSPEQRERLLRELLKGASDEDESVA